MKLAVSNIAWTNEEEADVAKLLQSKGVKYVEIAPTKLWDDPTQVADDAIKKYCDWWSQYDIQIVAFQSMLFARPDLVIFKDEATRKEAVQYLKKFLELAGQMSASKLVFGSPKNRQIGDLDMNDTMAIAKDFFGELGEYAADKGVTLCLEPNAPQYSCDFITNANDGAELVRAVNSEGFKLHLDTACMTLAEDGLYDSIIASKDILEHFHVSEPMLGEVKPGSAIKHDEAARALREINYSGYVSIEMRPGELGENVSRVDTAVSFVRQEYFN